MEAYGSLWARSLLSAALVLVAATGLSGCVGTEQGARIAASATGCSDTSGVQNREGHFQYGGVVSCKTGEGSHDWENPSVSARVQYGSTIAEGEIEITIRDAADRVVYQGTASPGTEGRQESSDLGIPGGTPAGTWTIELRFENVTGTLGLQIFAER